MTNPSDQQLRSQYGWAIEIISGYFSEGLERLCDPDFLRQRYQNFANKNDPVYNRLLHGMGDLALEQTFVSYWTIAQTLATQSRFWLDEAIAQIVTEQAKQGQRLATAVYSSAMLRNGLLNPQATLAELGEVRPEHLTNKRAWKESVQRSALQRIDVLVGDDERRPANATKPKKVVLLDDAEVKKARHRDQTQFLEVASSLTGPPGEKVTLQCNLLVIEPDRRDGAPHAWAIRYVNPKTFAQHPSRKQERVNALRLYALLVQEKILRDPKSIHVCVAELVPRKVNTVHSDPYPDYFSTHSFWSCQQLWEFIGVPFAAVQLAIQDVGQVFRDKLKLGLRGLLPK